MFEYDPDKSAANAAKHGIDFDQAQVIWHDGKHVSSTARIGGEGEIRQLVVGRIGAKLWAAIVTRRGENIRIISVRRARADERALYQRGGI